jgi:hypothetical protein
MAKTVTRAARDLQDGDELVFGEYASPASTVEEDLAIVVEKTLDEEGRVILMLSVAADCPVMTLPRPRELGDASPFSSLVDEDQQWAHGEDGHGRREDGVSDA